MSRQVGATAPKSADAEARSYRVRRLETGFLAPHKERVTTDSFRYNKILGTHTRRKDRIAHAIV